MKLDNDECQVNKYSNWMRMNTLTHTCMWGCEQFWHPSAIKSKAEKPFLAARPGSGPRLSLSLIWPDPLYSIPIHKSYGNLRENHCQTMGKRRIYRKGNIVRQDLDLDRRYANYKTLHLCLYVCVCEEPPHSSAINLFNFTAVQVQEPFGLKCLKWSLMASSAATTSSWNSLQLWTETLSLSPWAVTDCFVIFGLLRKVRHSQR